MFSWAKVITMPIMYGNYTDTYCHLTMDIAILVLFYFFYLTSQPCHQVYPKNLVTWNVSVVFISFSPRYPLYKYSDSHNTLIKFLLLITNYCPASSFASYSEENQHHYLAGFFCWDFNFFYVFAVTKHFYVLFMTFHWQSNP